jgi:hypothetical protein
MFTKFNLQVLFQSFSGLKQDSAMRHFEFFGQEAIMFRPDFSA